MKNNIKLLYDQTLAIILFVSCSGDNAMDIFSNTYLRIPDANNWIV